MGHLVRFVPTGYRCADAGGGVPGNGDHFVVAFLNPDRIVIAEMNDRSQRNTAVEAVPQVRVPRVAGDAALKPGVAGDRLCLGKGEVLHQPWTFGMFAKICMEKAVRAGALIGIAERELIPNWILLQEAECVTRYQCRSSRAEAVPAGRSRTQCLRTGLYSFRQPELPRSEVLCLSSLSGRVPARSYPQQT